MASEKGLEVRVDQVRAVLELVVGNVPCGESVCQLPPLYKSADGSRVLGRVDLIQRLAEMDESSHKLQLAELGPGLPAQGGIARSFPYTSLLSAVNYHFRCNGAERDKRNADGRSRGGIVRESRDGSLGVGEVE
jgi:hypothetical protein